MKRLGFFLSVLLIPSWLYAQEYFGQNKVQYDLLKFKVYKTEHFVIHYYDQEADAVEHVAALSEIWYDRLSKVFRMDFPEASPIILYASPEHFAQTDIIPGIIGEGVGGVTEGDKDRVIIPLTASWKDNNHVLGHELVHAFQYKFMKYGDSTTIRNISNLPLWMVEGLAEYLSVGPVDANTAMWLRDAVVYDDFPTLRKMSSDYRYFPYRWGQAFWSFVAGTWGEQVIPVLFRQSSMYGYETAIFKVLGIKAKNFDDQWRVSTAGAYTTYLNTDVKPYSEGKNLFEDRKAIEEQDMAPAISPNGKYVVFLSARNLFTLDMFLADARDRRIIRKLKTERGDGHGNFLRLVESAATWSYDSKSVAFFSYEGGKHYLRIQEAESDRNKKQILLSGFHSVLNPSWSPDGKKIAFVGVNQGSSDLYVLDVRKETVERYTQDLFADLQPAWSPDSRSIVFVTDRFSGTDFTNYYFGNYELARLKLETGSIEKISLFQGIHHINPQYNRDSLLYFIAAPDGVNNIYRFNPASNAIEQITHEKSAVSGITEVSPAMSIGLKTGDLVYSVFRESGYQLFTIRAKNIQGVAVNASETIDRSNAGLPPLTSRENSQVVSYLNSKADPASDSLHLKMPYRTKLSLSSISNAGIGVGVGPYGAGIGGAVTGIFTDMLNEHIVYGSITAQGTIEDIGGIVGYINQKHRLSWGGNLFHIPYGYASYVAFYDTMTIDNVLSNVYVQDAYILREFTDGITGLVSYPLSKVYRIEGGLGVTFVNYSYTVERQTYLTDAFGYPYYLIAQERFRLDAPEGYQYGTASLAFVGDKSKYGFTSPLDGWRYRIGSDLIFGDFNFLQGVVDVRAYKYLKPVSFAARFVHNGRYFGDATDSTAVAPLSIGYDYLVRGYSYYSYDYSEVFVTSSGSAPMIDRLYGSKTAVINLEVRFPLSGPREIAPIKSLALPSTLQLFFDGGVAWNSTPPKLKWETDYATLNNDPSRYPVFSMGASLRVNVLGALVVEGYYAIPFQRPLHDPFNGDPAIQSFKLNSGVWGILLFPGW